MKSPARTASLHRLRLTAAAVAVVLAATACAGTDPVEDPPEDTDAAPAVTTEAPTTTAAAVEVGPTAPVEPTEDSPDDTGAPSPDTTEAPPEEAPQIVVWSTPRLFETTLSASWQVTPADSGCSFDLLNDAGDVIGTGIATTADGDPSGRGMRADYDPASADALGTVVIRCRRIGGEETAVEYPVHRVTYQNRHPDSVIPATDDHYFDHDEIKALFPDCRPPRTARPPTKLGQPLGVIDKVVDQGTTGFVDFNDWLEMSLNFWDETFENWDTETHEINGRQIASGWWTTEQLRMMFPDSTITAEAARNEASYNSRGGLVWPIALSRQVEELYVNFDWNVHPFKGDGYYHLQHLYLRLKDAVGFVSEIDGASPTRGTRGQWVRDDGIAGDGPNPGGVREENLLWDWMDARYSFPPVDREPTAWAMRTLLNSRRSNCVAPSMREHCESGEFHSSRHMRHPSQGGSRLGSVLWSAVCPEIAP